MASIIAFSENDFRQYQYTGKSTDCCNETCMITTCDIKQPADHKASNCTDDIHPGHNVTVNSSIIFGAEYCFHQ